MKHLLILGLIFTAQAGFAYNCPASTNLTDPSSRSKCLFKVLTHWEEAIETIIIKEWQKAFAGTKHGGGLAGAGHWSVWSSDVVSKNIDRLIKMQALTDPLESAGVYQKFPTTLTCTSDDDSG